jgi:hypothetical protein
MHEMWKAPLHGFFHLWTCGMDDIAKMRQDWSGEIGGSCDVGIDARITLAHSHSLP